MMKTLLTTAILFFSSSVMGQFAAERDQPGNNPDRKPGNDPVSSMLRDLQEARELVEGAYSLRADVLRELLQHCTSVKTVRLCLQLGREASLPWAAKLDPTSLPTGSNRPWVSRSTDGLLVLKP